MFRFVFLFLCSLVLSSAFAAGTPRKAHADMLATFENFPAGSYSTGSTTALGSVYLLKADTPPSSLSFDSPTINEKLTVILQGRGITSLVPGKRLIQGVNYERVNESGLTYQNQCVAFAKMAMLSTTATSNWKKGSDLATLFPNGKASSQLAAYGALPYGTVIATFNGNTSYNLNATNPHVAIVQSVDVDSTGKVNGVWVWDQNGVNSTVLGGTTVTVGGTTTGGVIMRHYLPWSSTSTVTTLSLKNYSIVTDWRNPYT